VALAAARKEHGLAELGVWGLAARRASLGVRRSGRLQAAARHAGRRRRDDQCDDASSTLAVWPQKCWSEARPAGGTTSLGSVARVSRAPGSEARQAGRRPRARTAPWAVVVPGKRAAAAVLLACKIALTAVVCSLSGPYFLDCGLILENTRVLLQNGRYSSDPIYAQADPTVDNRWRRGQFPLAQYWPRIVGKR
jgi:hypothetical protein